MSESGDRLSGKMPEFDLNNPSVRAALYGNFGHYKEWREVVLANTNEIVRATMTSIKLTDDRAKNLAKTHPLYLDFLITHFAGRTEYENDVRAVLRGQYGA